MNKFLISVGLSLALVTSVVAQSDSAGHRVVSFLANQPPSGPDGANPQETFSTVQHYVWLTNGVTYWTTTNTVYSDGSYIQRWTYNTSNNPPMFYGATNNMNQGAYITNFINNAYIGDPQYIVYASTNLTSNTNNYLAAGVFTSVLNWCNLNGDVATPALTVTVNSLYSTNACTNTFTFTRSGDGYNYDTLNAANAFAFAVPAFAGTNVTYITNLPSTFMTGVGKIQLHSVSVIASNTTVPCIIGPVDLTGFRP